MWLYILGSGSTKDQLTIRLNNPIEITIDRLEVFDIHGKLLQVVSEEGALRGNGFELDTFKLIPGMCFVNIYAGQTVYQGQFVKI